MQGKPYFKMLDVIYEENDDLYDWKTSRLLFQAAQKLAEEEADLFTKDELDKFSARSHNLAEKAQENECPHRNYLQLHCQ